MYFDSNNAISLSTAMSSPFLCIHYEATVSFSFFNYLFFDSVIRVDPSIEEKDNSKSKSSKSSDVCVELRIVMFSSLKFYILIFCFFI